MNLKFLVASWIIWNNQISKADFKAFQNQLGVGRRGSSYEIIEGFLFCFCFDILVCLHCPSSL